MLYILFAIIILLPVLLGWGKIFEILIEKKETSLSEMMISGVFFISMLLVLWVFFLQISWWVEVFLLAVGSFSFLKFQLYQPLISFCKNNKILGIFLPVIAYLGAFYPFILDHFGYYVPTIKWLSEVGLVKGIANWDLVLGQMSFWHIFSAGFSHFSDGFLRINTLIITLYFIYIYEKKSFTHLFFIPILCLFVQSPSTDLPVIVFSLVILNEIFTSNKNILWLFALSVFVFTIKPTMIWLPLLSLIYGLMNANVLKNLWLGIVIGILFVLKNLWCFGYPFFPASFLDVGIAWKPNPELMKNSAEIAILKTYDLQYTIQEINAFSTKDYIINWFSLQGLKSWINILFALSLLVFTIFSIFKNKKIVWVLWFSVMAKSIFVVWFSAQYRFFIDVFFVVFFVLFWQKTAVFWTKRLFIIMMLGVVALLSVPQLLQTAVPSFRVGGFMKGFAMKQLIKPSEYVFGKSVVEQVGNVRFHLVHTYPFLFDVSLPAITIYDIEEYYKLGFFPQLYNERSLKSGFYWKEITEKEKQQLAEILEKYKKKK